MINHSIKRSVSIKNHPVILGKPLSFLHGFCLLHYPVILIHSSLEQYNAKVLVMHPVIRHMTRNNSIVQICVSKLGKASHKSEKSQIGWSQPNLMKKQGFARCRFLMNMYIWFAKQQQQKNIILTTKTVSMKVHAWT